MRMPVRQHTQLLRRLGHRRELCVLGISFCEGERGKRKGHACVCECVCPEKQTYACQTVLLQTSGRSCKRVSATRMSSACGEAVRAGKEFPSL